MTAGRGDITDGREGCPPTRARLTTRALAAQYGLSPRTIERARRMAADPLGRRLTAYLTAAAAERLVEAVRAGLMPAHHLRQIAKTAEQLIRCWKTGQLGAIPPPAFMGRRPPMRRRADVWMYDPRLVATYCRLARHACPALAVDLNRLLGALRSTLRLPSSSARRRVRATRNTPHARQHPGPR